MGLKVKHKVLTGFLVSVLLSACIAALLICVSLALPVISSWRSTDISVTETPSLASSLSAYARVQTHYEAQLAATTQALLEKMLGVGQVEVRVRALMRFNQNKVDTEVFNPQMPAIKSSKMSENGEEVEYAFSKKTVQSLQEGGEIQQLFVAVLLNKGVATPAMQQKVASVAQLAVGFDAERGDVLEVVEMPFAQSVWTSLFMRSPSLVVGLVFLLATVLLVAAVRGCRVFFAPNVVLTATDFHTQRVLPSAQIVGRIHPETMNRLHQFVDNNQEQTLMVLRQWLDMGDDS